MFSLYNDLISRRLDNIFNFIRGSVKIALIPVVVALNSFLISSVLSVIINSLSIAEWYGTLITVAFIYSYCYKSIKADKYQEEGQIIPMCSYCGKIRSGKDIGGVDRWIDVEEFICGNSESLLTHGICKDCYAEEMKKIEEDFVIEGR